MPTLSVILPNFNHGNFLAGAIEALLSQSLPPDELIVVDDGSTDDSLSIVQELAQCHPCIRLLVLGKNQGTNEANRRGRMEATGTFIFFAAADDLVLPGLFARSVELLGRHPDAGFCSSLVRRMDIDGNDLGTLDTHPVLTSPDFVSPRRALEILRRHDGWFRCNSAVYRRQTINDLGGFIPELGTFGDAFACAVIALQKGCCFIPEPLAVRRVSLESSSHRSTEDIQTALNIFGHAEHLMTTVYRDIFPADYVALWDRRWRYAVGSAALKNRQARPSHRYRTPDTRCKCNRPGGVKGNGAKPNSGAPVGIRLSAFAANPEGRDPGPDAQGRFVGL